MRSKQGWRHLTSAISHLATSICLLFGWFWWLGTVNWAEQLLCIFLAAFPAAIAVATTLPVPFSSFWAAFSNVRSFSSKSTVNAIRWRAGSIFTFEPIGVTVVAGSSLTRAACNSRASILSLDRERTIQPSESPRNDLNGANRSRRGGLTVDPSTLSNDNSVPWLIGQITGDAERKRCLFHLRRQPSTFLGHVPLISASPLSSTNRYTRDLRSTFTWIFREAGQDYGTPVVVGSPMNSRSVVERIITQVCPLFLFCFWDAVCVERSRLSPRSPFSCRSRDTLFFKIFAPFRSPPRFLRYHSRDRFSIYRMVYEISPLRKVYRSARKETWCSRSRKSRKSGSLYSVQRVVSSLLHSSRCPIWGREKIYIWFWYIKLSGEESRIYQKVNLSWRKKWSSSSYYLDENLIIIVRDKNFL